ncbi:hypothetical protein R3P38DRAFT_2793778 [Favolaschia claudopus]|uniref:Uncharacterized protein n=1 Tax=Favolaschia claudopus TaxID=2862362 RepID=A0AAW0AC00_9AGAR
MSTTFTRSASTLYSFGELRRVLRNRDIEQLAPTAVRQSDEEGERRGTSPGAMEPKISSGERDIVDEGESARETQSGRRQRSGKLGSTRGETSTQQRRDIEHSKRCYGELSLELVPEHKEVRWGSQNQRSLYTTENSIWHPGVLEYLDSTPGSTIWHPVRPALIQRHNINLLQIPSVLASSRQAVQSLGLVVGWLNLKSILLRQKVNVINRHRSKPRPDTALNFFPQPSHSPLEDFNFQVVHLGSDHSEMMPAYHLRLQLELHGQQTEQRYWDSDK